MPAQRRVISDAEIAGYAKAAGFSGDALVKAVAVALAESSGNIYAHNPVPPDDSYGLWQINMLGKLGPERRKTFGLKSNADLYNPAINAKAAFAISSGGKNFGPWSTYPVAAFAYMPRARKAAGAPSTPTTGTGVEQAGLFDSVSGITGFFELMTDPITWMRVGMFIGGGILLAIGLFMLSGQADRAVEGAKMAAGFFGGGKLKGATA